MTFLHQIHLSATVAFCVLLWMVQVLVYPQMARVRSDDFMDYHARHTRSITWLVAPLFFAEGLCAAASFWLYWQTEFVLQLASFGLFAANSLLTFVWFVQAHLRLGTGKDEALLKRLIAMNWWRTCLSTVRVILVMALVEGTQGI